jgi:hypothetical protein
MAEDYTRMWADLGLDLKAHDALLGVLGPLYEKTFMRQPVRPEGMKYFDFVMSEVHGLRIKELMDAKAAGRKVFGSFCVFVPEELILAVDGILVGLCAGAEFAPDEAEKLLPRNTCALIKSFFGFTLEKVCPYGAACDLIVGEATCDGKKKVIRAGTDQAKQPVAQLKPRQYAALSLTPIRYLRVDTAGFGDFAEGIRQNIYKVEEVDVVEQYADGTPVLPQQQELQENRLTLPSLPAVAMKVRQLIDQVQRQLPLGTEHHCLGNTGLLASLDIRGPLFRQVQPPGHRSISLFPHVV